MLVAKCSTSDLWEDTPDSVAVFGISRRRGPSKSNINHSAYPIPSHACRPHICTHMYIYIYMYYIICMYIETDSEKDS